MKIEKNIPIPQNRTLNPEKYGFVHEMNHGDSVFFKSKDTKDQYVVGYIYKVFRKNGMKATIRKQGDGYRVWAIKLKTQEPKAIKPKAKKKA